MSPPLLLKPTSSVNAVLKDIDKGKPVSASSLAQSVFHLHGEYANDQAKSIKLESTLSKKMANEWLTDVQALFTSEFSKFSSEQVESEVTDASEPVLHGRLFVIGLSLLEPELYRQLENSEAFTDIANELWEPLEGTLSDEGKRLYDSLDKYSTATLEFDTVPNWPDDALSDPTKDLLGRSAFPPLCLVFLVN